ncbi:MAG: response regulator, partial [Planctomycetaceae bacterium]|nr:response regulator [Planctomycetaceae bacterium]
YAPVKEGVLKPNPWLTHKKRVVVATVNADDKEPMELTLINPAWMTRQINEMQQESDKKEDRYVLSRLTSSRLINPDNKPNEWEKRAISVLESQKEKEFFEHTTNSGGEQIIRYAKPLLIAKGCLNCHGNQGYEVGDVRGIIATEVHSDNLLAAKHLFQNIAYAVLGGFWFVGIVALVLFQRKLKDYFIKNRSTLLKLRENESALRDHRDHLEELVADRTRSLQTATEAAKEANDAKTRFLAHMSHEIRTPLSGVIGISNLLMSEKLTHKQSEYVEMVLSSGETLLSLINDILDFSKIEANKLELGIAEFDLLDKLDSILTILSTRFLGKDVELCLDIGSGVPRSVIGDGGRFLQIILNFAGNAAKFTETGGVRISVESAGLKDRIAVLRFKVSDTGIGISENDLPKLFTSYTQADASISSRYGGTGLGLTIAQRLIYLMGGDITVESHVGVGTAFIFTIPFPISPEQEELLAQNPMPSAMSLLHLPSVKGIRVLLADDNQVLLDSLQDQLHCWGMETETANDPQHIAQALVGAQLTGKPFQLLILDEKFQQISGGQVITQIQEEISSQQISIIMLLSLGNDEMEQETSGYRITCVKKPYGVSALFDAVMNSLFHEQFEDYYGRKQKDKTIARKRMLGSSSSFYFLVAEDNIINQIVITEMLRSHGHRCDVVPNGLRAVEAVKATHYDAVFMDCQMPEMDGYEASKAIRQFEQEAGHQRIPIIALTANATTDDRAHCLESGMDNYCSKPIREEALFAVIKQLS